MRSLCSAAVHEFWFPLGALPAHLLVNRTSPGRLALWPDAAAVSLSRLCSPLLRWRLCAMQVTLTDPLGRCHVGESCLSLSQLSWSSLQAEIDLKLSTGGKRRNVFTWEHLQGRALRAEAGEPEGPRGRHRVPLATSLRRVAARAVAAAKHFSP